MLVSTLDRFQYRRGGDKVFMSNVSCLVIDEFDTFLDSGTEKDIRSLIEQFLGTSERQGVKKQLVLSTATVTSRMDGILKDYFSEDSDFKQLIEKKTHQNLSHLKHEFIQLADFDKVKPLKMLVKEFRAYASKNKTSAVIFCNSVQSARAIEHALAEEGEKTACLHGEIPPRMRQRNFERFKDRKADILVATDLASRGLDFPFVSHILNFDFPKSTSDYLHRAGRAGRAGREGYVLSLVRDKDEPIFAEMRTAHDNKEPLKIKGSAYSLKNKEHIIADRKRAGLPVSIGSTQASTQTKLGPGSKHVGSQLAPLEAPPESRTFKEFRDEKSSASLKLKKEKERVLRMPSKPRGPKQTFESARKQNARAAAAARYEQF